MKVIESLTWGGLDDMRGWKKNPSNPCSDVWLNAQKSAEAIVPGRGKFPGEWKYERNGKG